MILFKCHRTSLTILANRMNQPETLRKTMKKCSIFCVAWWPLIFIGIPLLFMLALLAFKWRFIETDVAQNTTTDLQSIEASWANVETKNRGRDVLITGTAPNQAAIDQVQLVAESSYGVNKVTIVSDIKAPVTELPIIEGEADSTIDTMVAESSTQNDLTASSQLINSAIIEPTEVAAVQSAEVEPTEVVEPAELPLVEQDICQDLLNDLLSKGNINFETAKATISASSFDLLSSIKSTADRCPEASFEIAGHTDSTGNLALNMSLSDARAKAVLDYLINLGLNESQLSARGYGPNKPIADNSTAIGRAKNRRIEFKLKN